ncbi:MAG: glycosyltransferase family 39 protein [Deltaproteobacteria bacterium]|nr:glycosyltransferase family 39 protein [Deltaproteobacteria bacterium]
MDPSRRASLRVLPGRPAEPDRPGPRIDRAEGWVGPLVLVVVLLAFRLWYAGLPGLVADEAYYWTWSRDLAAGYYDHPPGVAWAIRLGTALLGDDERGVRAVTVLLAALAAVAVALTSRRPWLTVAAACSMPLFVLGGTLATPDVPLVLGWALALAGAARGGAWWLLAGFGAGLAALGKAPGFLLPPLLALGRPRDLGSRWPWLGFFVFLALVAPHVAWLLGHEGVSLAFQVRHGLGIGGTEPAPGWGGLLAFLGGQAALVGPFLLLCAAAFWAVAWRERGAVRLWWWASFPPFLLFAGASLLARSEANWTAPVWVGVVLGLGHLSARWRRVAWVGVGTGAVASILLLVHVVRPVVDLPRDPTVQVEAGRVLGEAVQAWGIEPVYAIRYQEASWIRFYGRIRAEVLPGEGRPSQYDLWPRNALADHALVVRPWRSQPPRWMGRYWSDRAGPNSVVARDERGRVAGRWQVYEVRGLVDPGSGPTP